MIRAKLMLRWHARLIVSVLASFAILAAGGTTLAATQVTSACKPDTERWLIEKITAGLEADLGLCTESDRVLSADFIVDLLAGALEDVKVHYRGVRIANGVVAERLDLELAEISHETRLTGFRFDGDVDLGKSAFLKGLSFEGSSFGSANFTDMLVGGLANFDRTTFSGRVDFIGADIGGSLLARGAVFNNPEQTTRFNGLKVGGLAIFNDATFAGPVDFIAADISGQFQAMRTVFTSTANMNSMRVGTAGLFNGAVFAGDVSFRVSDIKIVNVTNVSWPGIEHSVQLDGMTYQIISAGDEILGTTGGVSRHAQESWKELLKLADRAIYSRNVYTGLEEFFRSQGEDQIADKFFVAQKRRQRKEVLGGPGDPAWWGSLSLDYLVLFGLSPHRAFAIGALFVLLGGGVYLGRANMQPRNPSESARTYVTAPVTPINGHKKRKVSFLALEALWALGYSLDLFLPIIDLQLVSDWRPRGDVRFGTARLIYMRVHTLVGWLLIPIGLLAVTGVFD